MCANVSAHTKTNNSLFWTKIIALKGDFPGISSARSHCKITAKFGQQSEIDLHQLLVFRLRNCVSKTLCFHEFNLISLFYVLDSSRFSSLISVPRENIRKMRLKALIVSRTFRPTIYSATGTRLFEINSQTTVFRVCSWGFKTDYFNNLQSSRAKKILSDALIPFYCVPLSQPLHQNSAISVLTDLRYSIIKSEVYFQEDSKLTETKITGYCLPKSSVSDCVRIWAGFNKRLFGHCRFWDLCDLCMRSILSMYIDRILLING